jgi:hypothetical protein
MSCSNSLDWAGRSKQARASVSRIHLKPKLLPLNNLQLQVLRVILAKYLQLVRYQYRLCKDRNIKSLAGIATDYSLMRQVLDLYG